MELTEDKDRCLLSLAKSHVTKQKTVALSTAESEYVSATSSVQELIWLERFVEELKVPVVGKAYLLCDNQSAIRMIKNPEAHQRTKHTDVRHHFIRDQYLEKKFEVYFVPTVQQKADLFTKALSAATHNQPNNKLDVCEVISTSQGECWSVIRSYNLIDCIPVCSYASTFLSYFVRCTRI